jgi:phosphate transport system permease protein
MTSSNPLTVKRYASERRFKSLGLLAIGITGLFLAFLLFDIISKAIPAFTTNTSTLKVMVDPAKVDSSNPMAGDYLGLVKSSWQAQFPDVTSRGDKKKLNGLISARAADTLQDMVVADKSLIGKEVEIPLAFSSEADLYLKGIAGGTLDEKEAGWLDSLKVKGAISSGFTTSFFTNGDSREPESAGIRGALIGSILTILVTLGISLPLGVAAALYLEEFAPKGRLTDLIEVNINNLAAVPSIIFGLLGLAVFLNWFGLPRSTALVGGLVLALLVLPTIIIASRAAIRSVPPSIKEAALGVGASHQQAVFHHVLPLAIPGILTGTILGVARALGETAPLLMIGMIAFIADIPESVTDSVTVLPVQVFLWSDLPEEAFKARTAAAILVLLVLLFCINALAIYLRNKFERRW